MIPHSLPIRPQDDWHGQLRNAITSADELLRLLQLHPGDPGFAEAAAAQFPLKVPMAFVRRMQRGDPTDPLLLQVLARREELADIPGYGPDPVGENGATSPAKGIIQKYQGRVLLIVSGGCAINCRYCFRRHFPYADQQNSRREWRDALDCIAKDQSISEVILSGGDPLLVSDAQLGELVDQIAAIPHVRRLRIHTRLPVVIPDRVTPGLLDAICREHLNTVVVLHSNHGNEIDDTLATALTPLRERGIPLLNQSVLLAGVNDSARALVDLSEKLFAAGILPYYLHLLDKVQGAAHFDVPEDRAKALLAEITAALPGYLVPKLVREVAGAPSKISIPAQP